jgi:hypothetical protein
MLPRTILPLSALALAGALFATPAAAQSAAHHDHAAHTGHAVRPQIPAQRWATDAPLRAGMRDLREATAALHHYAMGHLDDVQRDHAVEQIDAAINNMIAHCKLEPEADAALHGLLATFIAGANAARAGTFGKTELAPMQDALARYPRMFDDPGWSDASR